MSILRRLCSLLLPAVVGGLALHGCANDPRGGTDAVQGSAQLVDRVSSVLTMDSLRAIDGRYGEGCVGGVGSWTIAMNGYALVAGEAPLTVARNDTACELSVTGVRAGAAVTPQAFETDAPFVLADTFPQTGVAFAAVGAASTEFYATFRITPDLSFADDFVVQMIYSDDVHETDLDLNTTFDVVSATATASVVPAPDGTLSLGALRVAVDAHNIVLSATGTATFTHGAQPGESYTIDAGTLDPEPSFASVDAAFNRAGVVPVPLTAPTTVIAAADFTLVGLDVTTPQRRDVIVVHAEEGVPSYQLFQITVRGPAAVTR